MYSQEPSTTRFLRDSYNSIYSIYQSFLHLPSNYPIIYWKHLLMSQKYLLDACSIKQQLNKLQSGIQATNQTVCSVKLLRVLSLRTEDVSHWVYRGFSSLIILSIAQRKSHRHNSKNLIQDHGKDLLCCEWIVTKSGCSFSSFKLDKMYSIQTYF